MQLRVLIPVTSSLRSWNDYSAFERMLCFFPDMRISIVFTIGFVVFVHLTCLLVVLCFLALSLFPFGFSLPQANNGPTFFIRVYRTEFRRQLRAQHVEFSVGIAFSRAELMVFSPHIS